MPTLTLTETKSTCFIVYDGNAGDSYRLADGSTWSIGTTWHNHITGFKAALISGSGKNVLSFAGTDSIMDVAVDIQQVLGGMPAQYPQALIIAFQEMGRNSNLLLSGHSLGGGLAAYCSVHTRLTASTINPAPLIGAANLRAIFGNNDQITNYVPAGGEVVSSSPGRNPGRDVIIAANGNYFTRHMVANMAPSIPLPTKL